MMKKLNKSSEPPELLSNREILTRQYCKEGKKRPVWRRTYIIDALFASSLGTCAYCGCKIVVSDTPEIWNIELNKEDRDYLDDKEANENIFMNVDHYVPKKKDCSKVVDWDNLIPTCPKCNILKGGHDVEEYPIINPYKEDPRCYFKIEGCYVQVKDNKLGTQKLKKALKTLQLFQLVYRIERQNRRTCLEIQLILNNFMEDIDEAIKAREQGDNSKINGLRRGLIKLLEHGLPDSDYGALCATIILRHSAFNLIKEKMHENDLWSAKLSDLENKLKSIAYVLP